jgi:hypothetical protein
MKSGPPAPSGSDKWEVELTGKVQEDLDELKVRLFHALRSAWALLKELQEHIRPFIK